MIKFLRKWGVVFAMLIALAVLIFCVCRNCDAAFEIGKRYEIGNWKIEKLNVDETCEVKSKIEISFFNKDELEYTTEEIISFKICGPDGITPVLWPNSENTLVGTIDWIKTGKRRAEFDYSELAKGIFVLNSYEQEFSSGNSWGSTLDIKTSSSKYENQFKNGIFVECIDIEPIIQINDILCYPNEEQKHEIKSISVLKLDTPAGYACKSKIEIEFYNPHKFDPLFYPSYRRAGTLKNKNDKNLFEVSPWRVRYEINFEKTNALNDPCRAVFDGLYPFYLELEENYKEYTFESETAFLIFERGYGGGVQNYFSLYPEIEWGYSSSIHNGQLWQMHYSFIKAIEKINSLEDLLNQKTSVLETEIQEIKKAKKDKSKEDKNDKNKNKPDWRQQFFLNKILK